jgi:hypothetical protein
VVTAGLEALWSLVPVAAAPTTTSGLPDVQALTTLLTVESLTFAAFGIGFAVTVPVMGGRTPYLSTGRLARAIAIVLTLVAASAATAWWEVFMQPTAPRGLFAWAQALGIVVALVAQPYFAWRVALGSRAR